MSRRPAPRARHRRHPAHAATSSDQPAHPRGDRGGARDAACAWSWPPAAAIPRLAPWRRTWAGSFPSSCTTAPSSSSAARSLRCRPLPRGWPRRACGVGARPRPRSGGALRAAGRGPAAGGDPGEPNRARVLLPRALAGARARGRGRVAALRRGPDAGDAGRLSRGDGGRASRSCGPCSAPGPVSSAPSIRARASRSWTCSIPRWGRRRRWPFSRRARACAPRQTVAIGDNWNDREMLEQAGKGFVMGGGDPELLGLGLAGAAFERRGRGRGRHRTARPPKKKTGVISHPRNSLRPRGGLALLRLLLGLLLGSHRF